MSTPSREIDLVRLRDLERQHQQQLDAIRAEIESLRVSQEAGSERPPVSRPKPVRDLVLDALDDIGVVAYARELALYIATVFDRQLPSTRFGPLSVDERKAYERGPGSRPVWLCHGLTANRGEAIKRLWGRSDWKLEERVFAPTTGRVQHLRMTARLCEIAIVEAERGEAPERLERIRILAADHARDLPGVTFRRGDFPVEAWLDASRARLADLEERDLELRQQAASRLRSRIASGVWLLYGIPETVDGFDEVREVAR